MVFGLFEDKNKIAQQEAQRMQQISNSITPIAERNPLDQSVHIWALNSNDDNLFNFLMIQQGNLYNKSKNKWELTDHTNKGFNEQALQEIYKIMSSVANKSNALGILTKDEIKRIMYFTMVTLLKAMVMNKKRWELKDWSRDCIFTNAENQMFIFLTKALDGHTSTMHFGGTGVRENVNHTDSFDVSNNQGGIR